VTIFGLLLALAIALISFTTGQVTATQNPQSSKSAQLNTTIVSITGDSPVAGFQQDDPPRVDADLVRQLRANAHGAVSVSANKSTGVASFVRVSKDDDLHPGNRSNTPQGKANGFFSEYGGLFGVKNAKIELVLLSTSTDDQGATHMKYQQV